MTKRVAIIGAGPCGLAQLRAFASAERAGMGVDAWRSGATVRYLYSNGRRHGGGPSAGRALHPERRGAERRDRRAPGGCGAKGRLVSAGVGHDRASPGSLPVRIICPIIHVM